MSEKLDGVRGYWNGETFYSRQGNVFNAPKWFTADLPKEHLDGELWCGRGLFQKTLSIVKTQKDSTQGDWKYVTYLVFDAPKHGGKYEERVEWLKKNIKKEKDTTYAAVVGVKKCDSLKHMKQMLQEVGCVIYLYHGSFRTTGAEEKWRRHHA
jgi:DNA ligase-1